MLAAALAVAFLANTTRSEAVMVAFDPASPSINVGETVTIAIVIDRQSGPAIGGWSTRITYDPMIVSIGSITYGTGLNLGGMGSSMQTTPDTGTPGTISSLTEVSFEMATDLETGQPEVFTLATLEFTAIKAGSTALLFDLADNVTSVSDADGEEIGGRVMFATGAITVLDDTGNAVPEPSRAVGLIAVTLIGLMHRRRR